MTTSSGPTDQRHFEDLGSVHVQTRLGPASLPLLAYVGHARTTVKSYGHHLQLPLPQYRVFHYTLSGAGTASLGGQLQVVPAGYGFLVEPGDPDVDYRWAPEWADHWETLVVFFGGSAALHWADELRWRSPVLAIPPRAGCLQRLLELAHSQRSECRLAPAVAAGYVSDLLAELSTADACAGEPAAGETDLVDTCVAWMQRHLADDLQVADIAHHMHVSPEHLTDAFNAAYGMGPGNYLMRLRVRVACPLLRQGDLPIETIAGRVGYHPDSLTRAFKRLLGVTPLAYRHGAGGPTI